MKMIQGVVFDMDDTLYLERDYVRSGFRSIAEKLAGMTPEIGSETVFGLLWSRFQEVGSGDNFDRLLAVFPALQERTTVSELIAWYRQHSPSIRPFGVVPDLLARLCESRIRLGLITDGPAECQKQKWQALGLGTRFDACLFTGAWGREFWKPHQRAYEHIADAFQMAPERLVYVGDNPAKDFVTPRLLGWHTVRLKMPGQLHYHVQPLSLDYAPEREISTLEQLEPLLAEMGLRAGSKRGPSKRIAAL